MDKKIAPMKKETPEETYNRLLAQWDGNNRFELTQLYHAERLKIEAPTDEEIAVYIIENCSKEIGHGAFTQVYLRKGAKWMRKLLTGI